MSFKHTAELLSTEAYPLTAGELAERHGNYELDLPYGQETLGAVIDRCGADTFASADDAQETIYGAVSSEALGRVGYSDRDPTPAGCHGPDPVSF